MKRSLSMILSLLVLLILFSSCTTSSENRFEYPENYTTKYCYDNYSPMSLNYIYPYTYYNRISEKGDVVAAGYDLNFYAIPGLDINSFLACRVSDPFFYHHSAFAYLYRHKNNDIDPISDWEIDYIELCLHSNKVGYDNYAVEKISVSEIVRTYGDYIYHKNIDEIYNDQIIEQLTQCIKNKAEYVSSIPEDHSSGVEAGEYLLIEDGDSEYYLSIRIHFKETDMIMWSSSIILYNNHYYLENCLSLYYFDTISPDGYRYIPLTEELENIISSIIQSNK